MSAIETIALILVIVSAIKIVFLLVKPGAWFSTVGKLWMKPGVATVVALVLGGLVLKYLLIELTIVQIFAVMAFFAPLMWLTMSPYRKNLYDMATRELSSGGILKKNWFGVVIWILLVIWVLKELYA
ncbi:MAG: hypothetical protein A3A31_01910 [Candidatus Zambryskibacteria bacterium RIFCSPLOWO2_01_FULL_48_25]|uniref:Uncharacterized protein n=1 Tax=Candidatus Zambryskibacteria bacterium RIFCSPHIGHO2_01_FULL_46_25 TaxID=1802738 RepID=A0A1G2T0T8_9BACT|nr:MAG: hypothetical protein A2838_02770 [Candidatus Zambryskibacteria bacterium RIFCSPHIGHO2_01_FULL_46_25]OHB07261.1 MAG: hypothetical protein A3A31_01910 [Candidatus Zambryskibacteria bacterium RIFCSPLOWO2_01_FULL_48_25]